MAKKARVVSDFTDGADTAASNFRTMPLGAPPAHSLLPAPTTRGPKPPAPAAAAYAAAEDAAPRGAAAPSLAGHHGAGSEGRVHNDDEGSGTSSAQPTLYIRFSGSGWLLPFHCGVGKFIADHLDVNNPRFK